MHDQSDVGLVDAHAKGIGGYDDARAVALPVALALVFHLVLQASMVEGGAEPGIAELLSQFLGTTATAHIDDGRAVGMRKGVDEFVELVGGILHRVGEVLALEGHAEDVER